MLTRAELHGSPLLSNRRFRATPSCPPQINHKAYSAIQPMRAAQCHAKGPVTDESLHQGKQVGSLALRVTGHETEMWLKAALANVYGRNERTKRACNIACWLPESWAPSTPLDGHGTRPLLLHPSRLRGPPPRHKKRDASQSSRHEPHRDPGSSSAASAVGAGAPLMLTSGEGWAPARALRDAGELFLWGDHKRCGVLDGAWLPATERRSACNAENSCGARLPELGTGRCDDGRPTPCKNRSLGARRSVLQASNRIRPATSPETGSEGRRDEQAVHNHR